MKLNRDVIERRMDDHLRAGWMPQEAAGEVLWSAGVQLRGGQFADQSQAELRRIVTQWLGDRSGSEGRQLDELLSMADGFARYLADLQEPMVAPLSANADGLAAALDEWRLFGDDLARR